MKLKYFFYGFLGLTFIISYNAWLVHRDRILFEAYGTPQQEIYR
jgi:hypothetical protein